MSLLSDELRARLHDRYFVPAENPHGVAAVDTVFHYQIEQDTIVGTYAGGRVARGNLIGRATGPDAIELLYHCVTTDGELLAGWSRGQVSAGSDGRTTLAFQWGWLAGAQGDGESRYVEVAANA